MKRKDPGTIPLPGPPASGQITLTLARDSLIKPLKDFGDELPRSCDGMTSSIAQVLQLQLPKIAARFATPNASLLRYGILTSRRHFSFLNSFHGGCD